MAEKPPGPALAAASAAWAKTLQPRLAEDDACAWMTAVFPRSRHHCRAVACPRVCPRSPDHGELAPPPAWSATIPAMTLEEVAAAELGLASVRALRLGQVPGLEVAVDDPPAYVPTAEDDAFWAEQVAGWFPVVKNPPAPAVSSYPPCSACGEIRPVMIVLKATDRAPAGTICSRCHRGALTPR